MPSPAWHLEQHSARLKVGSWDAVLNIARPSEGLHDWQLNDSPLDLPSRLLGVALDSVTLEDLYVRGADLVATYAATTARPTRVQIYWRANPNSSGTGGESLMIDLQVSVQTHLLDSNPALTASSSFHAAEICRLANPAAASFRRATPTDAAAEEPIVLSHEEGPACVLVRQASRDLSYAEMIHPVDHRRDTLAAEQALAGSSKIARHFKLSHELFLPPLEKGVILRGRIRGMFLPRTDDESAAFNAYSEFVSAEPPLTT